jgi:glycogen debranching enzyme
MSVDLLTEIPAARVMPRCQEEPARESLLTREWLVTNGLGGFASGTISGAVTRRYHGLLVAALPAPCGRTVMWSHLSEVLRFGPDDIVSLTAEERSGGQLDLHGADYFKEFRLEQGLPIWLYEVRGLMIEKRIIMPYRQNTVLVSFQVSGSGKRPRLELRPAFNFRHYEDRVDRLPAELYEMRAKEGRYEMIDPKRKFPPLHLRLSDCDCDFVAEPRKIQEIVYRTELDRGYDYEGELWSPGVFRVDLEKSAAATLIGSTEEWTVLDLMHPGDAQMAECTRRERLLELGHVSRDRRRRSRADPGGRPVCYHPGRAHGRSSAGARRGRRSAHGHRGLSLVYRLGPRHHDQPGRPNDHHGPHARGGIHPAHFCPLRP